MCWSMSDVLQYRKVKELQFSIVNGEMKINMEGSDNNYYTVLDEVEIDPASIDMSYLEINKNLVKMKFVSPIICNVDSGRHFSVMKCGTKFEGKDKDLFVEKLEGLASRLGSFSDDSVQKRKEEIQSNIEDDS